MKSLQALIALLFLSVGIYSCSKNEINHPVLTLQPGGADGKDALFGKLVPDTNYGDRDHLHLYAWTHNGILHINRIAIEFDLACIPPEADIDSAYLSLYFNTTSAYGGHEGETGFIIQRITSDWEESTITWNTQPSTSFMNQVFVVGASLPTQDFLDIDITSLLQDMSNNREDSFGMMLKLRNEEPYRKVILAASEHQDRNLRPRLQVYYTLTE